MSLSEAAGLVKDGDHLGLSGFAVSRNAVAFSHELIRQGRRNLTISQAIVGLDADVLVGAGCVRHLIYGGGSLDRFGLVEQINRAYEQQRISTESYSSLAVCFRYLAGALGIPFMPIKSLLGSDIMERLRDSGLVREMPDPFTGEKVLALKALQPDFMILQAHMADEEGNARVVGPLWDSKEAARAARQTIVVAEELVPTEVIRRQPELTTIPGFRVTAVVPLPYGAHPTALYRYYDYDSDHLREYVARSKSDFQGYLQQYVFEPRDHVEYLEHVGGMAKLSALKADPLYGY
ncbi:MAG TPA: CoA-transferase [Chloroflexota bacterium]